MKELNIAVIGAGAAGMMAAYAAACHGAKVTIYEKNEKTGKKLFITGKGRCNLTNASDIETIFNHIVTNRKFMYSALYTFSNENVMTFFENHGLRLKTERGNRVFPESDKSSDVISTLTKTLKKSGVNILLNTAVKELLVERQNETEETNEETETKVAQRRVAGVILESGEKVYYDKVILATGGLSYPVTGCDGQGLKMLEHQGHRIVKPMPALVPMNTDEEFVKELQGLALKNIEVRFYEEKKKKELYRDFGELLFTHFGVSGPVILSASSIIGKKIREGNVVLSIDLKPALSTEQLDDRILRDFKENINKSLKNAFDQLLPKSLIPVIIDYSKVAPFKKVNEVSREERQRIVAALKDLRFRITSLRGFNEAIITSGGVNVKEIQPATMESKVINNLYVAGEMLDVDALTGGYNLQIAWSTGWLAGCSAAGA